MKIGLRGGHSPNCKGASGYLDEQGCVRELYYKLKPLLEAQGHTVIDCNSNASSINGELSEGTNKCNANNCELYITLHMNASNGQGNGAECWTYSSSSSTANAIGSRICSNLASLGLQNRGVKHSTGLHDTRAVKGQTCLIEVLFCDNKHDCDIWSNVGVNKIASLIASAICNKTINTNNTVGKKEEKKKVENIICYQHGLNENAAEYLGDFLNCATIEAHRPYNYKNVENIFAIGGDKKAYTSYLKTLITGSNEYNTFERTIGYILTKNNVKWNVTKYATTSEEKNAKNKLVLFNNYVDKRAAEYLAYKLNCPLEENRNININNYDFVYLVGGGDIPKGNNIKNIKGQDRYLTAKEVIDFMKFL
ncbi:TPA: N-acetylmuramoyl-L-alanine amidase [Clostridium botulinum]|nr:N-acetylmuramoyl-L-alanine amidase [Clostridium botulinum]